MDEPDSQPHIPHHPFPKVLLIQPEWPARALLSADMQERGCEVLAADSVALALDASFARGFRADVVVLDTVGLTPSPDEIERLEFLRGSAPLLVLAANLPLSEPLTNLLPKRVLRRPFSVGNVSDIVLALA